MKKKKKVPEKRIYDKESNLNDFGLEPPRIYRDTQRKPLNQSSSVRKAQTPKTRNEKRQEQTKKRKKKNKFRKFMIWFLVTMLLIAVAAVLSLTVFFKIETITVKGNERYTSDEILAHCSIDKAENLFLADTDSTKAMLEQNLPYIYNVDVKRKIPSSIELNVTECEPSFCIKNKDKSFILLDNNLKVLEDKAKNKKGIQIKNTNISKAVPGQIIEFDDEHTKECLLKLADTVIDNNISEITSIYSKSLTDNYVTYDGRIDFKLGNCDDLENKIYQALASCEQLDITSPNAKGVMTANGGKQIYFTEK